MAKTAILTVIVLLGLCSFTAYAKLPQSQEFELFYTIFKDWSSKFNKQFGIEELAVRFVNWKSNYDLVQEMNSKGNSFKLEMNDYADMSAEEFSALHMGFNPLLKKATLLASSNDNSTDSDDTPTLLGAPKKVDWRKSGAVSEVKNQGSCGGCYSFSAAGALEGLYAIKKKKSVTLSVQQLVDCSSEFGNNGCDGGLMTNGFQYTQKDGIALDSNYGYTASVGECKHDSKNVLFKNKGYKEVTANDYSALKAAVAKQPVSVGIEASGTTVQLYKSGVITKGCTTNLDHAVLVVGYDTDKKGQNYWIIKNSWGTSWGQGGYFHIAMGDQNDGQGVCGINMMASYPTL